jgi:hypothetical protein
MAGSGIWIEAATTVTTGEQMTEAAIDGSGYRCLDGPGPMGRHGHNPKKHGTNTTRPGTMVGPCLSRYLGTAAQHGHDTILGQPALILLKLCRFV